MKFIVDEMPLNSAECPFFKNETCVLDCEKCYYLTRRYQYPDGDIYYHEYGECDHLKPLESEDTE